MLRYLPPVYSPLALDAVRAAMYRDADAPTTVAAMLRLRFAGREVLLTDSGTSALALAMRSAARARDGRPCALPAYGCYDLISAALAGGVRVALYDIDPATLQPDAASLARVLATGVSAAVVVHHYGVPVPIEPLRALTASSGALLIEDAAQGAGGAVGAVPLGGAGDYGVLSFGRGKGTTGGGGGALLIRDAETRSLFADDIAAADESGSVRFIMKLAAQWALARPALYTIPAQLPFLGLGETVFRAPHAPRAMPAVSARVLARTLGETEVEAARRHAQVAALRAAVGSAGVGRFVTEVAGTRAGWLRFPVRGARSASLRRSGARLGCVPGYPQSLATLPEAAPIRVDTEALSGARELADRLWTVPVHGLLGARDIEAIAAWIRALPN